MTSCLHVLCRLLCRQRDKHAADAGKLAIGIVDGKRERRPVKRFQPEAPRPKPAGDDGKTRMLSSFRTVFDFDH